MNHLSNILQDDFIPHPTPPGPRPRRDFTYLQNQQNDYTSTHESFVQSEVQALTEITTMIIVDKRGRKIRTITKPDASLAERLLSVGTLIPPSTLDKTGIIFVYLDEEEEKSFMEYYKKNFWVKRSEDEIFYPMTQDFEDALESLVSSINKNRTNGWGRFIPCIGTEVDILVNKKVYGWIYIPVPQYNIVTADRKKIILSFHR